MYNIRTPHNILLANYDKSDNDICITGYIDYSDIIGKRPIKEWLYKAYYRDTIDGNLRVRKYV